MTPRTVARLLSMEFPSKNTGMGCLFLLQGIFPSQEMNPGLPHCRWILYVSPGKPKNTGVGSLSFLQGNFLTQESTQGLPYCRWILHQLSYLGSICVYVNPNFLVYPSPLSTLVTVSLFSMSMSIFLFCKYVHLYHLFLVSTYNGYHRISLLL